MRVPRHMGLPRAATRKGGGPPRLPDLFLLVSALALYVCDPVLERFVNITLMYDLVRSSAETNKYK